MPRAELAGRISGRGGRREARKTGLVQGSTHSSGFVVHAGVEALSGEAKAEKTRDPIGKVFESQTAQCRTQLKT